jgi:hypothetical protein
VLLSLNLVLPWLLNQAVPREFFESVMGRKYGSQNMVRALISNLPKLDGLPEPLSAEKLARDMGGLN